VEKFPKIDKEISYIIQVAGTYVPCHGTY